MKQQILKLNANYFPIGIVNWKEAMVDIVSGASYPIDIHYEKDNSEIDKAKISYVNNYYPKGIAACERPTPTIGELTFACP
jgi:hypothetical protein